MAFIFTTTFKFQRVHNDTVEKLLKHIKTDTATGADQIPSNNNRIVYSMIMKIEK